MTDKKRTSITVDKDVYQFLSQAEINQSGLINELVKEYRTNKDRQVAALELRYKHLKEEQEEHEEKAAKKAEQAQEVKDLLDDAKQAETKGIERARDALQGIDDSELTTDNPAVKNWAGKLGIDEATLLNEL